MDSPYFETGTAIHDHIESSDGFDGRSEGQAGFFGLQDVESGSAVQSSSSKSEHNIMGKAVENVSQEITSPSSGNCCISFISFEFGYDGKCTCL